MYHFDRCHPVVHKQHRNYGLWIVNSTTQQLGLGPNAPVADAVTTEGKTTLVSSDSANICKMHIRGGVMNLCHHGHEVITSTVALKPEKELSLDPCSDEIPLLYPIPEYIK